MPANRPAHEVLDGDRARQVVPGGWRRMVIGFVIGAAVGAAVGLVLPRDDGPHRRRG